MLFNRLSFRSSSLQLKAYGLRLKNSGFSLIELLIVLTIMGLLGSIVMPNSFNMLEQHKAQLEQKKLIDFFRQQQYQAYLLETRVSIEFAGAYISSSLDQALTFSLISAEHQQFTINDLGNFEQAQVRFFLRQQPIARNLGEL